MIGFEYRANKEATGRQEREEGRKQEDRGQVGKGGTRMSRQDGTYYSLCVVSW